MQNLIEYIARSLVDSPMEVHVVQQRRGNNVRVRLSVAQEDMGRVIGKNGRVANAMRVLLRVAAAHDGSRAVLDIIEPR